MQDFRTSHHCLLQNEMEQDWLRVEHKKKSSIIRKLTMEDYFYVRIFISKTITSC